MSASEVQIRTNQANSLKSTGPKTIEGKKASRANAIKHGLTATVVLPELEAAEVERRFAAFSEEFEPSGAVGIALVGIAATMSVRMERCVKHENAMLTERVRQAEADFVSPEGVDAAEATRLRSEAGKRVLFDTSKEATLARKYEADASRRFFRALKELRLHEKAVKADEKSFLAERARGESASIFDDEDFLAEFDAFCDRVDPEPPRKAGEPVARVDLSKYLGGVDVPFSIGKPR